jgi:spore coat protein U-like protein
MRNVIAALLASYVVVSGAAPALAETATAVLSVSATVSSSCVINSVAPVSFGVVDPARVNGQAATGAIAVTCPSDRPFKIQLGKGEAGAATVYARRLIYNDLSKGITYSLYKDARMTQVWGDQDTGEWSSLSATGTGAQVRYPIYGKMTGPFPQGSSPDAGPYSDTVTITVDF